MTSRKRVRTVIEGGSNGCDEQRDKQSDKSTCNKESHPKRARMEIESESDQEINQLSDSSNEARLLETPMSTAKVTYQTYFNYQKNAQNERSALCLLCKEKNVEKEVKMKNGNTTGLKFHLGKAHAMEYEILFGSKQAKEKKNALPNKQELLNKFLNTHTREKCHYPRR